MVQYDSCILYGDNASSVDWGEIRDKLKPGAHAVAICPVLEHHRITQRVEDAGFEIRDCLMFLGKPGLIATLARVPLEGTVAENVLRHGVGGINIDGTRVSAEPRRMTKFNVKGHSGCFTTPGGITSQSGRDYEARVGMEGRWPANCILYSCEEVIKQFPESRGGSGNGNARVGEPGKLPFRRGNLIPRNDNGSASRFSTKLKGT